MKSRIRTYVCVSACAVAAAARAEELTLEAALDRARGVAGVTARFRVEEARARRRAAGAFRENPALDAAAGRRPGAAADYAVGLSHPLDFGRGGRVAGAEAALLRETAAADGDVRLALRAVALAFQRGLAEGERLRIAREAEAGASELVRVAERRHAVGDVADLDVGIARAALARTRADALAAEARAALAHADLRSLLAYDGAEPLVPAGELVPPVADAGAALADAAAERPDVRAAEAEVREAEAESALARALARPQVAPSVRVERDEGTHVLWGGLTIGLPLWNRGTGEREAAAARASRLRARVESVRRAAREEAAGAHRAYALRLSAVRELAQARALADDSEALAVRSYEEGQIGLGELLLARREARDLRAADVDHRQEAAAAAVELLSLAGRLR